MIRNNPFDSWQIAPSTISANQSSQGFSYERNEKTLNELSTDQAEREPICPLPEQDDKVVNGWELYGIGSSFYDLDLSHFDDLLLKNKRKINQFDSSLPPTQEVSESRAFAPQALEHQANPLSFSFPSIDDFFDGLLSKSETKIDQLDSSLSPTQEVSESTVFAPQPLEHQANPLSFSFPSIDDFFDGLLSKSETKIDQLDSSLPPTQEVSESRVFAPQALEHQANLLSFSFPSIDDFFDGLLSKNETKIDQLDSSLSPTQEMSESRVFAPQALEHQANPLSFSFPSIDDFFDGLLLKNKTKIDQFDSPLASTQEASESRVFAPQALEHQANPLSFSFPSVDDFFDDLSFENGADSFLPPSPITGQQNSKNSLGKMDKIQKRKERISEMNRRKRAEQKILNDKAEPIRKKNDARETLTAEEAEILEKVDKIQKVKEKISEKNRRKWAGQKIINDKALLVIRKGEASQPLTEEEKQILEQAVKIKSQSKDHKKIISFYKRYQREMGDLRPSSPIHSFFSNCTTQDLHDFNEPTHSKAKPTIGVEQHLSFNGSLTGAPDLANQSNPILVEGAIEPNRFSSSSPESSLRLPSKRQRTLDFNDTPSLMPSSSSLMSSLDHSDVREGFSSRFLSVSERPFKQRKLSPSVDSSVSASHPTLGDMINFFQN